MSYETNFQIGVKASPEDIYKRLTEPKRLSSMVDRYERQRHQGRGHS